jgi:hypothetical protein
MMFWVGHVLVSQVLHLLPFLVVLPLHSNQLQLARLPWRTRPST